ncbi:MAG: hypothetical protein J6B49_01135 [Phascolarctobacterium sp.]|nr:hypothetical protein [Phascolarctobacterium sp.]MBR6636697.1 hypothetical protein [Phascolarctobacterium sp.]
MAKYIGAISQNIINLLGLNCSPETPIYIGEQNEEHMKKSHQFDYEIYRDELPNIIANPDYVGLNKDNSIEYIKEFPVDDDFVKVAVRVSTNNKYFARTLYTISRKRVLDFLAKGTIKKV